jgi:ABC-type dipeptide/oligopeptide/nickel transport system permease subunit
VFADQIAPFTDHYESDMINANPGSVDSQFNQIHWMGTDDLGRDIFTRLLYATRISLLVGLSADALIIFIGLIVGVISGYSGGMIDNLLMRFTDAIYAFPSLLFTMVVIATLGRSIPAVLFALVIASWVGVARLVRGQVLQIKQMDYIVAAHSIGASPTRIVRDYILPNTLSSIITWATLALPGIMTAEAALAFLGVGIDPSLPTLGRLINAGMENIFSHPTQTLFPVLTLTLLTLAFTLIGDGIRDALDPRL